MSEDILRTNKKAEMYIKNYLLEENNSSEINIKPSMNLISWYWGSWKTRFIDEVLLELRNKDKYKHWKTLIRIQFNPRDFQSTKNIYQHFFEIFIKSIIKEKYDWTLKSNINTLLNLLDNSWSNYLKLVSNLAYKETLSIDDMIEKISKTLMTTYHDYVIVVVIDEIDRVEEKDLVNVWKILNLVSKLIEIQKTAEKDKNLLCLYSVDLKFLSWFSFWNNWTTDTDFYQYYNRFRNTEYDVYNSSKYDLVQYIFEKIEEMSYFDLRDIDGISSSQNLKNSCQYLFSELEDLNMPIVIRDAIYLFDNLKNSLNHVTKELELYFRWTIYSDILNERNINYYLQNRESKNQYIFLDYVYIKSIYQKDFQIINKLDSIYNNNNLYFYSLYDNEEEKHIIEKTAKYFTDKYKFKYRTFSKKDFNFENFIKTDYPLISALIFKDNLDSWINAIINEYEKDILYNLCTHDLYKIDDVNNIEKILFSPRKWTIFSSRNHFTEIHNTLLNNRGYEIEEKIKFFENSVEIFKRYISDLKNHSWEEINNSDTWFIITVLTFFHMFIRDVQSEIFDEYWNWKQWMEKEANIIIDWIAGLIRFCDEQFEKWTKLRLFFLYFYLRLIRYWIYRYEEKNNLILENIFKAILSYYYRNNKDFHLMNTEFSTYSRLIEYNEFKNEMEGANNNLVKYISNFFTLIKCNWHETAEILKIIETIIYAIFYQEKVNKETEIREFINTYIKNKKHKFLLLCNSLVYNFGYEQKSEFRNTFKSLNDVYKTIYNELNLKWSIDELFEKHYEEICVYYEDERHQTKETNLKELVDGKILKWKEFAKKSILHILNNFYNNNL